MSCQIIRSNTGEVQEVLAPNGNKSILYNDIKSELGISSEESLHVWAKSYTQPFQSEYNGARDHNGEPQWSDAKDLLRGITDLVLYEGKTQEKLVRIGRLFNMTATGFMGYQVNPEAVRQELRKNGVTGVTVSATSNRGGYFFSKNGKFYNPFNPPKFQLSGEAIPPDIQLDGLMRRFLGEIDVTVENVTSLPYDATARVNIMDSLIEIAEGKAGRDTLPEEAAHMAVAMMRGTRQYNVMAQAIKQMPIYENVAAEYKDLEGYDEKAIIEEAIVKLVTSEVIKEYEQMLSEGTLSEENLNARQQITSKRTWLSYIIDYLKSIFKPSAVTEFRRVAKAVLHADLPGLTKDYDRSLSSLRDGVSWEEAQNIYYQITPNAARQNAVTKKLEDINNLNILRRGERYYSDTLKKEIRFRPSDKVERYGTMLYGRREFTPEYRKLYTTKGTIIHAYNQVIAEHLIKGYEKVGRDKDISVDQKVVTDQVYDMLRTNPEFDGLTDKGYYSLAKKDWNQLLKGVAHILSSIYEYDPGAKVFTEQIVYDPRNTVDDIAGTIDLMVIYSDGTLGLYDYKSMQMSWDRNLKQYSEIDERKRQLFDIQLSQYKNILTNTMELTDADFREIRIIPINMQFDFSEKGDLTKMPFKKIEMYRPSLDKEYLNQITVARELVPEDETLNTFLEKLYNQRTSLRSEFRASRGAQRRQISSKIEKLNKTINDLIVNGDVVGALEDIATIVADVKANINDFDSSKLLEYVETVKTYDTFNNAFRKTFDGLSEDTKEDKEIKEGYRQRINHFNDMIDMAKNMLNQRAIDIATQYVDRKSLLDGGEVRGFLGAMFEGIGQWNNPVIFAMGSILAEQREKEHRKLLSVEEDINKVTQRYTEWANKNGLKGIDQFKPLINQKTGDLITPFKKEFYDVREKMISEGIVKFYNNQDYAEEFEWLKEHYEFNEELWTRHRTEKEKELKLNANYNEKDIETELNKYDKQNPNISEGAFFIPRNIYIHAKKPDTTEMQAFLSEEWKFIHQPENKPALDFYQMHTKYTTDMANIVGWDLMRSNFVANVHRSTVERLGNLGFMKEFTLLDDARRSVEIRENDVLYGAVDSQGNPIRKIPVLFLDDLKGTVSFSEKQKIKEEVLADGFKEETVQFYNEIDRRVGKMRYEKGVEQKSRDLAASLKLMLRSVYDYKYKREIEDDLLVLRHILTLDEYKETPTDRYNKALTDYFTEKAHKRQGADPATLSFADRFINMHLYGQHLQSKDKTFTMGDRTYSVAKTVGLAQQYLSVKNLGLNPILAGASHFNAVMNKRIVGKRGIFFSNDSWKEAVSSLTSSDEKSLMAIWFMQPSTRDVHADRVLQASGGKAKKSLNMRTLFAFHRGFINKRKPKEISEQFKEKGYYVDNPLFGDDMVGNSILLSMLRHWVLDSDGKIRSKGNPLNPLKDPNAKTLWELFDPSKIDEIVKDPEGNANPVAGLDQKEYVRFKRLVELAQARVKGSLGPDNALLANTWLIGQVGMKFRNWMPGLITERWGALRWNPLLESIEQGHHRGSLQELVPSLQMLQAEREAQSTAIGTLIGGWILPTLGNFLSLGLEATSMGLYKHKINPKRAEYYRLKFLTENAEIDADTFTLDRFMEFRRGQIRAMATEVRWALGILSAILTVMAAAGWDDEDDTSLLANYLFRLTKRTELEMTFFFSVKSVNDIVKSPIPVWGVVTDMTRALSNFIVESAELIGLLPENDRDRTPFGYYTLKQTPIVNQVLSLNNYFQQNQDKSTFAKIIEGSTLMEDIGMLR